MGEQAASAEWGAKGAVKDHPKQQERTAPCLMAWAIATVTASNLESRWEPDASSAHGSSLPEASLETLFGGLLDRRTLFKHAIDLLIQGAGRLLRGLGDRKRAAGSALSAAGRL